MTFSPDVLAIAADLEALARSEQLAVVTDLDGTLIPFAATVEEAALDEAAARTLRALVEVGVQVFVVSGRPRALMETLVPRVPGAWWSAEHGAWRWEGRCWVGPAAGPTAIDAVCARLETLARSFAGARVERKAMSVCLHWRQVAAEGRARITAAGQLAIGEWLEGEPEYELLPGVEMVEVRPRGNHKGVAVAWLRERLPGARILSLGDDVTDEDMFRCLGDGDLAIRVGPPPDDRRTHARAYVPDISGARGLLQWIAENRAASPRSVPDIHPVQQRRAAGVRARLLVVSNRMPLIPPGGAGREVGGLVAALEPALATQGGTWLGWSGAEGCEGELVIDDRVTPVRASFDLSPAVRRLYYTGFCNRSLWPLLHGFPGRVRYEDAEWAQYREANQTFARHGIELCEPDATVWVHDYHLFLAGRDMRRLGHRGAAGFFLHVPFPMAESFDTLPWAREVLEAMLDFDLVGFQTWRHADNFLAAVRKVLRIAVGPSSVKAGGRRTTVTAFPIGIDARHFLHDTPHARSEEVEGLRAALGDRRLLLGVDRLDYSKGVPERLEAFERLLERHPRWQRRVSMVQVSVPSRADVPEYAALRQRVENLVSRINGRFGDADWVPVRYLYRAYGQDVLAQLYRAADIAVVTPLRDGMNLVAKEFVAAQDPSRPGVLVLSRFAGAADELTDAVLTNPYHRDGLADDLDRALSMSAEDRVRRHRGLRAKVLAGTSARWAAEFLGVLSRATG